MSYDDLLEKYNNMENKLIELSDIINKQSNNEVTYPYYFATTKTFQEYVDTYSCLEPGEHREETVESVAEPFLVRNGLMARTSRGRVATAAGFAHIGRTPPAQFASLFDTPAPDA